MEKNPVDFPLLPIFSDSELSPTYPLPPFSSKSKNIQLRKYKHEKGTKPKPGKKQKMKLASNSQQRSIRA